MFKIEIEHVHKSNTWRASLLKRRRVVSLKVWRAYEVQFLCHLDSKCRVSK